MLPDIHDQHLTRRQGKQRALAFKVLVLAAFATVRAFDVHDQNVVGHCLYARRGGAPLILRHPDTLCRLPALLLRHDAKARAEQVIQQRGLARGLGAEHGDEVVVEAGGNELLDGHVGLELRAAQMH